MFPCPAAILESPAPSEPERQQEPGHGQQDASTPRKHHTQYRRFTESEATQTDPGRILTDALYQLQIARDFGMDVLNTLAEKARQQQAGHFYAFPICGDSLISCCQSVFYSVFRKIRIIYTQKLLTCA